MSNTFGVHMRKIREVHRPVYAISLFKDDMSDTGEPLFFQILQQRKSTKFFVNRCLLHYFMHINYYFLNFYHSLVKGTSSKVVIKKLHVFPSLECLVAMVTNKVCVFN